jgi:predicted nucleic acid-binding protein
LPAHVVIDANVAVKLVIVERDTAAAVALQDRAVAGDVSLCAPDTWLAEAVNAVWTHVTLLGTLTPERARAAVRRLRDAPVVTTPTAELAGHAFALALRHRATFYDALYLSLAAGLGAPLATRDAALARHARARGVALYWP